MEFAVKTGNPEKLKSHCLIVGIFETQRLSAAAERLNNASEGAIGNIIKKGDIDGKVGQVLLLHQIPNIQSERILLVGCGKEKELGDKEFRDIIHKSISTLIQTSAIEAVSFLTELTVKGRDSRWKIRKSIEIIQELLYSFEVYKSKAEKPKKALKKMNFSVSARREITLAERGIQEGEALTKSVAFAKNLANQPPNIRTPSYLAKEAEKLAKEYSSISVAVLNEKEMTSLKMGALLSVGKGSINPPRLITLEYRGRQDKQKPIVLVGKGITFDTGGNSLKPPMSMIGMKYDMCGGAAVLAVIQAAADLQLPLNIVGIVAAAENMPGNTASRPEDIVTSMSGTTIEILNTDAEGRLVLSDALTYCERFNPDVVIDIATLTSACIMALGSHSSGLMSNHPALANDLFNAGIESGDRCWQLPLWDEYQEALSSRFADVANIGSPPEAGAILAGCFLSRFTKKYHWAHLDVAGTAFRSTGKDRGATGRPIPLLLQYLLNRC